MQIIINIHEVYEAQLRWKSSKLRILQRHTSIFNGIAKSPWHIVQWVGITSFWMRSKWKKRKCRYPWVVLTIKTSDRTRSVEVANDWRFIQCSLLDVCLDESLLQRVKSPGFLQHMRSFHVKVSLFLQLRKQMNLLRPGFCERPGVACDGCLRLKGRYHCYNRIQ